MAAGKKVINKWAKSKVTEPLIKEQAEAVIVIAIVIVIDITNSFAK